MKEYKTSKDYESLPKIHGWVARQPDGSLWLFAEKPYFNRCFNEWGTAIDEERELGDITDSTIFSDLTWESEPVEVELLIRKI